MPTYRYNVYKILPKVSKTVGKPRDKTHQEKLVLNRKGKRKVVKQKAMTKGQEKVLTKKIQIITQ